MTAPLTYLKVFFLLSASILLIACHSSSSNNSPTPDINTLHIYTSGQTIYSFNEDTGISTKRGQFDSGDNKFLELNTDEEKQGYEYAVYVFENVIYLLNYDKASNAQTITLAKINSNQKICGLIPHKTSSKASFNDGTASNRSTLDLASLTIEYQKNNQDCNRELNVRDTLDFNAVVKDPGNITGVLRTLGRSENVLGSLVIDYSAPIKRLENAVQLHDQTGFLGQDIDGNKIVFNYTTDAKSDQWETGFYPSSGVQTIHQVSNNQVVVRKDDLVYILSTKELFKINNESNSTTPIQEKLDKLFDIDSLKGHNLDTNYPISFNQHQNINSFLLKYDNSLFYYSPDKFTQIPINETQSAQNAIKTKFDLTRDNTVLVIQEANNLQTLLAISTLSGQSETIISASKIEFYIIENEFYVNTYESQSGSGWQAHWFKKSNNTYTARTYDYGRFIFANDLREKRNSIFLLSSNDTSSGARLNKPSLYIFDKNEINGRKKGRNKDNAIVDFSFGSLNTNVSDVVSSFITNDIYGRITLKGINEDTGAGQSVEEYYYFNPTQSVSMNDDHLLLMSRKAL